MKNNLLKTIKENDELVEKLKPHCDCIISKTPKISDEVNKIIDFVWRTQKIAIKSYITQSRIKELEALVEWFSGISYDLIRKDDITQELKTIIKELKTN